MRKKKNIGLIISVFITIIIISGCSNSNGNNSDGNIEVNWWGDQSKHERRTEAIKDFEKENEIETSVTYSGWDGYWDKLSTKISGGNAPDVFLMSSRYMRQYAEGGSLMELDDTDIDLDSFEEEGLDVGKIDGKLYGIPTGLNAMSLIYNEELLKEADVSYDPDERLTWDEFANLAEEITEKLPEGKYAVENSMRDWEALQYFTRNNGESFYAEDGKSLGISKETLTNWFNYWLQLQEDGVTPSADETSSYQAGEHEQMPIVKGDAVFVITWNNEAEIINNLTDGEVKTTLLPKLDNGHDPDFLHGSAYWVISDDTDSPEESAELIEYLLTDPEVGKSMGTDEGVPSHIDTQEDLKEEGVEKDTRQISLIEDIKEDIGDTPNLDIATASTLR